MYKFIVRTNVSETFRELSWLSDFIELLSKIEESFGD